VHAFLFGELAEKRVPEDVGSYLDVLAVVAVCVCLRGHTLQNLEHLRAGEWFADACGENEPTLLAALGKEFVEYLPGVVLHGYEFSDTSAFHQHVLKSAPGVLFALQSKQLRHAEP
jgi:hypothetical protein